MTTLDEGVLSDVVQRLVAEFDPEAIYLFGSHAWGLPNEHSDIDLFVIVPESEESSISRAQRAYRVLGRIPFAKDVVVGTRAEVDRFKHLRASLTHQVLHQGRKLYG